MEALSRGVLCVRAGVLDGGFEVLDCTGDEDEVCAACGEEFGDFFA